MDKHTLDQLIEAAASRWGLPVRAVAACVQVESGGDPDAERYEEGFQRRYLDGKPCHFVHHSCTKAEEIRMRATSYGLMQVMGQVAREGGFTGRLTDLKEAATGLDYGCRHLAKKRDLYLAKRGWAGVFAAYNAGSPRYDEAGRFVNQWHVDKVLKALGGRWPQ